MRENHVVLNLFKGVNLTDPNHTIDDRELQVCQNFLVSDTGDIEIRKPMRTWWGDAGAGVRVTPLGVFYNRLAWVTSQDGVGGGNFYLSPVDTTAPGQFIPANQAVSWTTGRAISCAVLWNKALYMFTNGAVSAQLVRLQVSDWLSDNPTFTQDEYTLANCTSISRAVAFKDRIFAVQNPSKQSSRVFYSDVTAPTSWPSGNIFDVSPGDGDYITGLLPFQERLYVFKRRSTWIVYATGAPASWVVKLFDNSVGAVAPYCVLESRGLFYVLSPRGLYRSDGVVYDYIGYPVQGRFLDRLPVVNNNNFSYDDTSITLVDDNIFVNFNNPLVGYWSFNPIQNAWAEVVFGGNQLATGQLGHGVQGFFKNGKRGTWFGCQAYDVNNNPYGPPRSLLWFDPTDIDAPAGVKYVDKIVRTGTEVPIETVFWTKKWDNGNFYRTKRHVKAILELIIPTQGSTDRMNFKVWYNLNENVETAQREYRVSVIYRGLLAHRVHGVGYERRVQMKWYSNAQVYYSLTALDMVYLLKREMSEVRQ